MVEGVEGKILRTRKVVRISGIMSGALFLVFVTCLALVSNDESLGKTLGWLGPIIGLGFPVAFLVFLVSAVWESELNKQSRQAQVLAPPLANRRVLTENVITQAAMNGEELCARCGTPMDRGRKFCGNCGHTQPGICHKCGASGLSGQKFCPDCGAEQKITALSAIPSGISPYYQEEFTKIAEGNGYMGKFNWAAFIFGAFWGLAHELWLPALIAIVLGIFTGGIAAVVYWIIFGARGNLMYYKKVVKGENALF